MGIGSLSRSLRVAYDRRYRGQALIGIVSGIAVLALVGVAWWLEAPNMQYRPLCIAFIGLVVIGIIWSIKRAIFLSTVLEFCGSKAVWRSVFRVKEFGESDIAEVMLVSPRLKPGSLSDIAPRTHYVIAIRLRDGTVIRLAPRMLEAEFKSTVENMLDVHYSGAQKDARR